MCAVTLQFLGTGDAFAGGGRLQACLHLRGEEESLLVDCGATGLVSLKRAKIDPASIGFVALSHLHGDHFGGLVYLILDGQFSERAKPLVIAGPPGTDERIEQALAALYPGSATADRPFETQFLTFEQRTPSELGPARITPWEVQHGGGAPPYALRIEYGEKVVAYSGDTEWTDTLPEVARGADLFVCECNFFDQQIPGHLDYRTLLEKRDQLDTKRIVLTHLSQEMLEHLDEVELEVATDGLAITL